MHNQFSQILMNDQYQALHLPEHAYVNVSFYRFVQTLHSFDSITMLKIQIFDSIFIFHYETVV